MPQISDKAVVASTARIAPDVAIGPFAYVGPEVEIRAGSRIDSNASVTGRTVLGEKTHIFPQAVVGTSEGGDGGGRCVIGQANDVREHATIYGGSDEPTRVGDGNLVMIACEIGPGASVGDHGVFANCTHVGARAVLEDYVRTSGFATIRRDAVVGAYAFIAGHAVIERHAPPFSMVQGFPFRVRGVNSELLRRCGFADADIQALRAAFRELFNDHADHARPAAKLADELIANPNVARLVEFLERHGGESGADNA